MSDELQTLYNNPSRNGIESSFRNYYSPDRNKFYSYGQDEAQDSSEGLYRRTVPGKMIIDAITRQTIGKGLTPMSAPERDLLGWTEEQTYKFCKQSEAFWRITTNNCSYDWYGKNNGKQLQQMAFKNILIAGDTLQHLGFRRTQREVILPYCQLISGRMVTQSDKQDTKRMTGGVELDAAGRELAYYLRVIDNERNDTLDTRRVQRYNPRTGRLQYNLISIQRSDPGIIRGIPFLTTLKGSILGVGKFQDNHLLQSTVQNIFTAFIETDKDAVRSPVNTFKDKVLQAGAKPDPQDPKKYDMGSGLVVELDPGQHANLAQRQAQGEDYQAYLQANIGLIASACGLSYETVMNSFNASYSASRAGISVAEKNNAILREEFVNKFCEPMWAQVIDYGVLTGRIEAPGYLEDPMIRKAALATTWVGVTPPQVDPLKDVNAYGTAIKLGICTRSFAVRQLWGMDFAEVVDDLERENRRLEKAGLSTEFVPTYTGGKENEEDDNDNNQKENPDEKE